MPSCRFCPGITDAAPQAVAPRGVVASRRHSLSFAGSAVSSPGILLPGATTCLLSPLTPGRSPQVPPQQLRRMREALAQQEAAIEGSLALLGALEAAAAAHEPAL